MKPRILAVIPVSGQDPEFRRKTPMLGGKPLTSYTFEAARAAKSLTRVVLSTDSAKIAKAGRAAGVEVPFVRSPRTRSLPMAQVLLHAVEAVETQHPSFRADWVVRLQVTFPFREPGFIDSAVRTVLAQDLDSAFIALPEYDSFWLLTSDGTPERITTDTRLPRAKRRPIYRELGGLFSMVHRSVLEQGTMHGQRLGIIPTEAIISAIDVHAVHGGQLAEVAASTLRRRRTTDRR